MEGKQGAGRSLQVAARLAQAATHNFDSASMCNALGVAKKAARGAGTGGQGRAGECGGVCGATHAATVLPVIAFACQ